MREIKFRGKIQEGYENAGQWEYFALEDFIDDGLGAKTLDSIDFKTIGQYIGVKDKNKKEIYAGDILKDYEGNVFVIVWDERETAFVAKCINDPVRTDYPKDVAKYAEIIGNIYENSELLKKVIK